MPRFPSTPSLVRASLADLASVAPNRSRSPVGFHLVEKHGCHEAALNSCCSNNGAR